MENSKECFIMFSSSLILRYASLYINFFHHLLGVLICEQTVFRVFIAEIWWPFGPPSRAPYRKAKETHELIFLWLLWLVVLLVSVYAMTTKKTAIMESYKMVSTLQLTSYWRHTPLVYSVVLRYIQNKVSSDQYNVIILWAQG